MEKRFAVLTRGRTGSTLICDTINRLQHVLCDQELLLPLTMEDTNDLKQKLERIEAAENEELTTIERKIRYLEDNYCGKEFGIESPAFNALRLVNPDISYSDYFNYLSNRNQDKIAIGFKVLANHLGSNEKEIENRIKELVESSVKILYLQRRDKIREAFSSGISIERKIFNIAADDAVKNNVTNEKITISPEFVLNEIKYIQYWAEVMQDILNRNNAEYKIIYFEDFLEDKRAFLKDILVFLGLKPIETILDNSDYMHEGYLKVTPDNLANLVDNYIEIIELIKNENM